MTIRYRCVVVFKLWVALGVFAFSPVVGDDNMAAALPEVKMIDVLYYKDGGTTGFVVELDGKLERFCLDGRGGSGAVSRPRWHVFLGATHPTHAGASKVPIGGEDEARIIAILSAWINSELPASEQVALLQGPASRTDLRKTKLWWAMRVRERLAERQISPNNTRDLAR